MRGARALLAALWLATTTTLAANDAVVFKVANPDSLQLFLRDPRGHHYGSLQAVDAAVRASGHKLVFAMNAGMYRVDRSPVGLLVHEDGGTPVQMAALNTCRLARAAGTPNFYAEPNGVFAIAAAGSVILSTQDYARSPPAGVRLATQSGPLLLRHGQIVAPAVATGTDAPARQIRRNGICVDGRDVVMVEADAMTLHQFAVHLRDVVHCTGLGAVHGRRHLGGVGQPQPGGTTRRIRAIRWGRSSASWSDPGTCAGP